MLAEVSRVQGRVLLALILRESRVRYGNRRLGYTWALIEPLLHVIVLTMIFTYLRGRSAALGDSLPVFLATGMATYFGFRNVLKRTMKGYTAGEALLSFPVVKVPDIFVARAILDLATWIAVTILLLGGLVVLGFGQPPRNLVNMLGAILALFLIAFGLGTTVGIASQFVPSITTILRFPLRLLYFLSGVFYLPENMIPSVRDVIAWNPVMHGITLFRMGYYEYYDSFLFDGEYLMGWAIGSMLVGLIVTRASRRALAKLP